MGAPRGRMAIDLDDDRIFGSLLEGRWRIVRRIGKGGMGQVFQVVHAKMGMIRCVKILKPGADEVLVRRFEREVQLAQQIRHPNVIRIDDFGIDRDMDPEGGLPYYVMEFAEGKSLRDLLAPGELPVARAARIIQQVARGVAAAHARNIIHRDIKPENVVVGDKDHVTVLDFGIAKLKSPDTDEETPKMMTLTRKGEIWATPQYMSPEQATASPDLTPRTDVYCLGVVLFECLAGELPFAGETPKDFIVAHIQKEVPSVRKRRPELSIPSGLDALVSGMLAKRPDRRPSSMQAVAEALEPYARGEEAPPAFAPRPAGESEQRAAPAPSRPPSPGAPRPAAPPRAPSPPAPPQPRTEPAGPRNPPRVAVFPHGPVAEDGSPLPRNRPFAPRAKVFVNLGEELHEHQVGRARISIGRKPEHEIFIPDSMASKEHAEILEADGRFYVVDLDSRNGTFLGKKKVSGRALLRDREVIRIGGTFLHFCRGEAKASDLFAFCPEGHPSDRDAHFCGSCGRPLKGG